MTCVFFLAEQLAAYVVLIEQLPRIFQSFNALAFSTWQRRKIALETLIPPALGEVCVIG